MLSEEAAIANAEYICYASPNSLVYNNETYIEDMGEDAIAILYPDNFNFAEKYDANCYKDLDKDTKQYLNSLWEKFKTGVVIEGEEGAEDDAVSSEIVSLIVVAVIIAVVTTVALVNKKKKRRF